MAELSETVEMATLDKEMAEERSETLQIELEAAKEKLEELQLDLDIIKAEMGDDGSAEGWTFFFLLSLQQNFLFSNALTFSILAFLDSIFILQYRGIFLHWTKRK